MKLMTTVENRNVAPSPQRRTITRRKILFMAGGGSLAHVARPLALIDMLKDSIASCDLFLGADPCYSPLLGAVNATVAPLPSIPTDIFRKRVKSGVPFFDAGFLAQQLNDDYALIDRIKPDLIIGDFRVSLSVSARKRNIPYWTITNTHWLPEAKISYKRPDHDVISDLVPEFFGGPIFRFVFPRLLDRSCQAWRALLKENSLVTADSSPKRMYADADRVLLADLHLAACENSIVPSNYDWIGPLFWSVSSPLPAWWNEIPKDRPTIFFSLGTTGDAGVFASLIKAIETLPVTMICAGAGRAAGKLPANVFLADYLPGEQATRRANLVICNGGISAHQAMIAGVPVLGLASILDQHANMEWPVKEGIGERLYCREASVANLRKTIIRLLQDDSYRRNATAAAEKVKAWRQKDRFISMVHQEIQAYF